MIRTTATAALAAIVLCGQAIADEVYTVNVRGDVSDAQQVVYEIDKGQYAVWGIEGLARFYIYGLAGVYSGRTSYDGWYVVYQSDDAPCAGDPATDHNGKKVPWFGKLKLDWSDDANFVMTTGQCQGALGTGDTLIGRRN